MQEIQETGLIPELGRFPGEGNGNRLQYSCLENLINKGAWRAIVHGVAKSWTPLSNGTCMHASAKSEDCEQMATFSRHTETLQCTQALVLD